MKNLVIAAACAVATLGAVPASAVFVELGSYSVTANTIDPGLVVTTTPLAPSGYSFELASVGDWELFPLFTISTSESTINGDDTSEKPISLSISLNEPQPNTGGGTTGNTDGHSFFGALQWGSLTWDNDYFIINYGADESGEIAVYLSDVEFGGGFFGLNDDPETVYAKFKLLTEANDIPNQSPGPVPGPAAIGLLGLGLFGIGAARRARRSR